MNDEKLLRATPTEPLSTADPRGGERGGSRHTPGPWRVRYIAGGGYDTLSSAYRILHGPDDYDRVVEVDTRDYYDCIKADDYQHYGTESSVEAEANAHLIAAAPDLLRAAKAIASFAVSWQPLTPGDIKELTDAIAKAEGRS